MDRVNRLRGLLCSCVLSAFVAFAPNGSFWLGDVGNNRYLHFSAGNTPVITERFAYIPCSYSTKICRGDPTRILSNCLEFQIDYSKSLSPTNGTTTPPT